MNDRDISNVLALQIDLTYLCRLSILAMQKHVTLPLGKVVVFQISWSFATLQIEIRAQPSFFPTEIYKNPRNLGH